MKKTIITAALCLGLAGALSAETVKTWDTLTYTNNVGSVSLDGLLTPDSYGEFSVTALLDAPAVKTALQGNSWGKFLWVTTTQTTTNTETGEETVESFTLNLALNGSSSDNNDGIWGGNGNSGNSINKTLGSAVSNGLGQTYAGGTTYTDMAITMSVGYDGLNCYLTAVKEDGTVDNYAGVANTSQRFSTETWTQIDYTDKVTYLELDNTYLDSAGAKAANYALLTSVGAIPEPATATLSLLALAGLAARRRRK